MRSGRAAPVAVLFPGQASQQSGMGVALFERSAAAREIYALADKVSGLPITELCCTGTLEELTSTEVTQLAVVATSLAVAASLEEQLGFQPTALAAAGHSVGELTAMGWAGALTAGDTLRLVQERSRLMARDSEAVDGSMAAIIGLTPERLEAICAAASEESGASVQVANLNAPDQSVISGARAAVEAAIRLATKGGAQRAVPLTVGGPFHSVYMASAGKHFAAACGEIEFRAPRVPIVLNTTAAPSSDPEALRGELPRQITSLVRWGDSIQAMAALGCETFVELGPGRVLSNLVRRSLPGAQVATAGTPAGVAEVASLWASPA